MHAIAHLGSYETATYTINRFNLSDTPEALIAEWVEMAKDAYSVIAPKDGALEFVNYLFENKVKIAVASATERELIEMFLCSQNILEKIDTIVTISDVKRGKEFPDIYFKCAENMNLDPKDCMVCEDLLVAVKGAKSGGFYTVGVYDEYSKNNTDSIKECSDKFIYSFYELMEKEAD
jgi:beta-phosphoglucomutase-like phosphatase (HAD superfamily)